MRKRQLRLEFSLRDVDHDLADGGAVAEDRSYSHLTDD
jgi:hypothetical protein